KYRPPPPSPALRGAGRRRLESGRLLAIGKTRATSPVHRRVPMDDLAFTALDATGSVVGVRRCFALFTGTPHAEEAAEVPILRRMLRQIIAAEGVIAGSHDWRE